MTAWKDLKSRLQGRNLDTDQPHKFIIIDWAALRKILKEEGWKKEAKR